MKWNEMKWEWTEELKDESLIEEFEGFVGYTLPEDFKAAIPYINGGSPEYSDFNAGKSSVLDIDTILSFNKDDTDNIWNFQGFDDTCEDYEGFSERYVSFAISVGGDHICFDRTNNRVVYVDLEYAEATDVAASFTEFIDLLYNYEDEDEDEE